MKWEDFLHWAEYGYKTSFHSFINASPFEVVRGRPPPVLANYERGTAKNDEVKRELITRDEILVKVKKELMKAQARMKSHYDQGRCDVSFELGDFVYLKLQPYTQKTLKEKVSYKFSKRFYGPFKVLEKIGEVAYQL